MSHKPLSFSLSLNPHPTHSPPLFLLRISLFSIPFLNLHLSPSPHRFEDSLRHLELITLATSVPTLLEPSSTLAKWPTQKSIKKPTLPTRHVNATSPFACASWQSPLLYAPKLWHPLPTSLCLQALSFTCVNMSDAFSTTVLATASSATMKADRGTAATPALASYAAMLTDGGCAAAALA
jgi:hypothetical protein